MATTGGTRSGDYTWEERHAMWDLAGKVVAEIQAATKNRRLRRAVGAMVLKRLAQGFCLRNKITERHVADDAALRDLFLRDLLRKKKIELRHTIFVRHVFTDGTEFEFSDDAEEDVDREGESAGSNSATPQGRKPKSKAPAKKRRELTGARK
jgi:hypothetical protein